MTTATVELARATIMAFASEHKIVFEDRGECGIGRPCVGLLHGSNYVAYHPTSYVFDSPFALNISDVVRVEGFQDECLRPPDSVTDAYHKGDCIAVLVRDGDYDRAILQLADWVEHLKTVGVEIAPYPTGAQGVHALVHGIVGHAIRVKAATLTPPSRLPNRPLYSLRNDRAPLVGWDLGSISDDPPT